MARLIGKLWDKLFSIMYGDIVSKDGASKYSVWSAVFQLSIFMYMNTVTIFIIGTVFLKNCVGFELYQSLDRWILYFSAVLIFIVNTYTYVLRKRGNLLAKQLEHEQAVRKKNKLLSLYQGVSVLAIILAIFLLTWSNI